MVSTECCEHDEACKSDSVATQNHPRFRILIENRNILILEKGMFWQLKKKVRLSRFLLPAVQLFIIEIKIAPMDGKVARTLMANLYHTFASSIMISVHNCAGHLPHKHLIMGLNARHAMICSVKLLEDLNPY